MTSALEPLAIAFANTRSSIVRDRIATLELLRRWAQSWPVLASLMAVVPATALPQIHAHRDATQLVVHDLADRNPPRADALAAATTPGLATAPFTFSPAGGQAILAPTADAVHAALHLLGRAVVDLLLSPTATQLRRCDGTDCLKVFVSQRADRRWCDSRICGNRARVAAHTRRHNPNH